MTKTQRRVFKRGVVGKEDKTAMRKLNEERNGNAATIVSRIDYVSLMSEGKKGGRSSRLKFSKTY